MIGSGPPTSKRRVYYRMRMRGLKETVSIRTEMIKEENLIWGSRSRRMENGLRRASRRASLSGSRWSHIIKGLLLPVRNQ
jgi:hypothetical protein